VGGRINTPSAKPASAGAEITNHRGIRMCIRMCIRTLFPTASKADGLYWRWIEDQSIILGTFFLSPQFA